MSGIYANKFECTCIMSITANPKVKEICKGDGRCPRLPTQPIHPKNTKIPVPINSARHIFNISDILTSSFKYLLTPEIHKFIINNSIPQLIFN